MREGARSTSPGKELSRQDTANTELRQELAGHVRGRAKCPGNGGRESAGRWQEMWSAWEGEREKKDIDLSFSSQSLFQDNMFNSCLQTQHPPPQTWVFSLWSFLFLFFSLWCESVATFIFPLLNCKDHFPGWGREMGFSCRPVALATGQILPISGKPYQ